MGCACLGRKALRARLNVCSFEAVACVPRAVGRYEVLESRRETIQAVRCWQRQGLGRMLRGSRPLFSRFPLFSLQKGFFFRLAVKRFVARSKWLCEETNDLRGSGAKTPGGRGLVCCPGFTVLCNHTPLVFLFEAGLLREWSG